MNGDAMNVIMSEASSALKSGRHAEAQTAFERALQVRPQDPQALAGAAAAKFGLQDFQGAVMFAARALKADPRSKPAIRIAVAALNEMRDWRGLLEFSRHWTSAHDRDGDAWRMLANAQFELGDYDQARSAFANVVALERQSIESLSSYARYCLVAGDHQSAEDAIRRAMEMGPPSAELLFALSRLKYFRGEFSDAEKYCGDAMKADPEFAPAYAHFSTMKGGDVSAGIAAEIERFAGQSGVKSELRASMWFALGQRAHIQKRYDAAMRAYAKGNALTHELLRAEGIAYDPGAKDVRRAAQASFYAAASAEEKSSLTLRPVFIVGMPRSGTTLLEGILAAHPSAVGLGERSDMQRVHNDVARWAEANNAAAFAKAPREWREAWRRDYYRGVDVRVDASVIVDKQPVNFQSAALISRLFPEARIVHIRRDALETCFSIWRNDFSKLWKFAARFEDLADYYARYLAKSDEELRVAGAAALSVEYEALISNPRGEIARILTHCGLDWSDRCLEPEKHERTIATFSALEARKPISKSPNRASPLYGPLLDPLRDVLRAAGVPFDE